MFNLSDPNVILTGILLIAIAWSLKKNFRMQKRVRDRDPLQEAKHEIAQTEQKQVNRLNQLEVKLFDYGREVEARSDDRLRVLDELLQDADREINRLRQQLALTQQNSSESANQPGPDISMYESSRKISASLEQRSMIVFLSQAGFSVQEISNCFQHSVSEIETILTEENEQHNTDVA